ncbi:MAG: SGNH/GDSL hydrolase family protein, partial [Oscillospiraceae bacterium]
MNKRNNSSKRHGTSNWMHSAKPMDFVLIGGIGIAAIAIIVIVVMLLGNGKTKPVSVESIPKGPDSVSMVSDKEYNKDDHAIETSEFMDTILPLGADLGNDYVKDTLFIGDSNTVRMMSYGHSTLENNVSAASMGIQHVVSKPIVFFKGFNDAVTVPKAVSIIQPKRIIITYGTNNTIGWSASTLIAEYKKAVDAILKAYPDTDVIINAVPPIDKQRENLEITMQTIDSFNKALAEFAKKEGYKFLNSAETLKDAKTGYAKTDYTISDGVHLSKKGMDALFKYVRTHTFETEEHRKMPLKPVPGRKETPPNIITEDPLAVREQKKGVSIVFTNANPDNGKMKGETKQTVKGGETCTEVTALPNEGFVFAGWSCTEGRIEDVTNPLLKFTVPPTKEKEIVVTASFAPAVLSLTNDSGAAVTAATLE